MKLPRDVSGSDLARALAIYGYSVTRQTGSHLRMTTQQNGEYHITVPLHRQLRVGTLAAILADVAEHCNTTRDDVAERLFGA
ncbi:MAG: type II toxin-antitoxin system HicA family toxin [Planctomycetes bacterium]|nr:type II toxin-antitoxin system HicA family toxin [Planctomycetota bacterium]